MQKYIGVKPAGGRDYKSQAEVKKAWAANADFIWTDVTATATYVSRSCAPKGSTVVVRYGRGLKTMNILC